MNGSPSIPSVKSAPRQSRCARKTFSVRKSFKHCLESFRYEIVNGPVGGKHRIAPLEMIALTWADVNELTLEVTVLRPCVRNRFGDGKNTASPVLFHCIH